MNTNGEPVVPSRVRRARRILERHGYRLRYAGAAPSGPWHVVADDVVATHVNLDSILDGSLIAVLEERTWENDRGGDT